MAKQKKKVGRPSKRKSPSVLVYLCNKAGITLYTLAEMTEISVQTLYRFTRGGDISLANLKKLAYIFSVPLSALAKDEFSAAVPEYTEPDHVQRFKTSGELRILDGARGEAFVLERERQKLKGTPWAELVSGDPAADKKTGYDIDSFDAHGNPKHIEVKSTKYDENADFLISACELRHMKKCMEEQTPYELIRVWDIRNPLGAEERRYTAEEFFDSFVLIPMTFICRRKEKDA